MAIQRFSVQYTIREKKILTAIRFTMLATVIPGLPRWNTVKKRLLPIIATAGLLYLLLSLPMMKSLQISSSPADWNRIAIRYPIMGRT